MALAGMEAWQSGEGMPSSTEPSRGSLRTNWWIRSRRLAGAKWHARTRSTTFSGFDGAVSQGNGGLAPAGETPVSPSKLSPRQFAVATVSAVR